MRLVDALGLRGLDRRIYIVILGTLFFVIARIVPFTFVGIHFVRDLEIAAPVVGAAFLVENVTRGLVGPFGGALSDRVGRRPVLAGSALVAAVAVPAFLLVRDVPTLFAWSVVAGLAQGAFFPANASLLLDLAPPGRRQSVLALNYSALSVGYTLGVAPAGFLVAYGYESLAVVSAAAFLAIAAIQLLVLRGELPREAGERGSLLADTGRAGRDPAFVLLASLALLFPIGVGLLALAVPLYMADQGIPEWLIGIVLSSNGLVIAALTLPVNVRVERMGPFRFLPLAAAFVALSYVALAAWPTAVGVFVAVTIFTFGEILFSSALPTAVSLLAPKGQRGAYQGAWGLLFAVGVGSALFLSGLGRDHLGWPTTWAIFTAATILAGGALLAARARLRATADERQRA